MRFVMLTATGVIGTVIALPLLLVIAIAAGPVLPMLLLAAATFVIVWLVVNALLGAGLSVASLLRRHTHSRQLAA